MSTGQGQELPPEQQPPPGWWLASDGRWYPPQGQSPYPPPPPPTKKKGGCLKWGGIVVAVLFGLVFLSALFGLLSALFGGGDGDNSGDGGRPSANGQQSAEPDLFPNRPDEKPGDRERNIGEEARLSGYTVTVTDATFQQQLSEFETSGYLVASVTLSNRDEEAQPYNTFDWKLITPGGTIIDPYFGGEQLGSGDLVTGGSISGQLNWEVGNQAGDYYIIYDPPDFGNERAVWKVTL